MLTWKSAAARVVVAATIAAQAAGQEPGTRARFVQVADVVGATVVGDPEGLEGNERLVHVAEFSPDGRLAAVVVRHGNVAANTVESSILIFTVADLFRHPLPDTVVSFASSSNRPAVTHVRWLSDSHRLSFLGEQPGELPQVYSFDLRSRVTSRLTKHPTPIRSYDVTPVGDVVAYTAEPPSDTVRAANRLGYGYLVTTADVGSAMLRRDEGSLALQESHLFVKHLHNATITAIPDSTIGRCPDLFGLSVSPTGRFVIRQCIVLDAPGRWVDYTDRWVRRVVRTHRPDWNVRQYMLIDTERGTMTPLIDAPVSMAPTFAWGPDGRSVVVGNAYLPLDVADSVERRRRTSNLALFEVDLASRTTTPIAEGESLGVLRWDARTNTVSAAALSGAAVTIFRKISDHWTRLGDIQERSKGSTPASRASSGDVALTLEEGLNEPPMLIATDKRHNRRAVVLNANPQFRDLRLGKVEAITWTSDDGARWRGGLYYPPDYVVGHRYPLAIQTHGFDSTHFSLYGSYTTAFAAQPLAAHGILVLQADEMPPEVDGTAGEASAAMRAFESAIDYLDGRGLIDRKRIGLVGFSRTCWHVKYALTHSRVLFAAASVSDGIDLGYFQYMLVARNQREFEADIGAAPFGAGLDVWRRESPSFNLEKVVTPVRIEAIGSLSVLSEWEWYAGLKRLGRPVEMHVIPDGAHLLVKPWERLASSEGTVDWFRFWLKNEEDSDPAKREQYARWRELRKVQQERAEADTARPKAVQPNMPAQPE